MSQKDSTKLSFQKLPNYEVLDLKHPKEHPVLRQVAKELCFPLGKEDMRDVRIVEAKYDNEINMAGLAAPQIGIAKKIIVFAAPLDPELKKWRSDLTQGMPKTIWINPTYKPIGEEKNEDYEACFSVKEVAGPVKRYKRIQYDAFTIEGNAVSGIAEGFLARVIQHEVDHVNATLFVDYVPDGQLLPLSEYRNKRLKAIQDET